MLDLKFYNTMSRQEEIFRPINPLLIGMYVCGPTVYDYAHVGNARPAVVFDVLYRLLKRRYPRVTYVQNITDIDDKIMARAKESGEPISSITARTEQAYMEDMAALNVLPPDMQPHATGHIPEMIALIETLIAKKHAYVAEGHVLFNVPSMPDYGALSRLPRDELIAGARIDVAPYKQDPADFVLWKPSTPDQPGWDSPWGRGRPGWHIECSAMAKKCLGVTFDIHGGGLDLRFPHHENEIAQSCCAHDGAPLANYWLHNGFLSINGAKMSKSLGNFFTVRELLAKYPGEVIRLVLLSTHYRQPLDFTDAALEQAKVKLDKWYRVLLRSTGKVDLAVPDEIESALADDLNTPKALTFFDVLCARIVPSIGGIEAHAASGSIGMNEKIGAEQPYPTIGDGTARARSELIAAGNALGLLQQDPENWFKWQPDGQGGLSDSEIEAGIAARNSAKQVKNFAEADRIRQQLLEQNIILEDKPGGKTEWRRG